MKSRPFRYALGCVLVAAGVGLPWIPLAAARGTLELGWGLSGFALASAGGVVGGAWLVALHGTVGARFLVAVGVCMLARLLAYGAGAFLARQGGRQAVWSYVAGLGLGYLTTQAYEMIWFARAAHRPN